MIWLNAKWQVFRRLKQPHPSMDFYDRAWLKEADAANRREAILYLVACFVVFVSMVALWVFSPRLL
jgi:hypothetical protein